MGLPPLPDGVLATPGTMMLTTLIKRQKGPFVYEHFPPRHRRAYNEAFFRKVLVTAVKVSQDLADPHGGPAACTVEEILRSSIGREAMVLCEEAELGIPCAHPDEILLEDVDFECYYDDDMDGLEGDPVHQVAIQVELPDVADWFTPFNDSRIVHPYARTEPSGQHELHDLRRRFRKLPAEAREALKDAAIETPRRHWPASRHPVTS